MRLRLTPRPLLLLASVAPNRYAIEAERGSLTVHRLTGFALRVAAHFAAWDGPATLGRMSVAPVLLPLPEPHPYVP